MIAARAWAVAWAIVCLLLVAIGAGAAPQLLVPPGRLGQADTAGPLAAWHGEDGVSFLIQAGGDIASASGTLQRRSFTVNGDGTIHYAAEPAWDAAALLSSGAVRDIFTGDPSGATVPFTWDKLAASTRLLLDRPQPGAAADGLGELRTAFVRGERARELGQPQGQFRKRTGVLGDIVNSIPLIVGSPPADTPDNAHAAFRAQFRERELAVYVGANDGMLHAFSAVTGAELFAYVPGALASRLAALSSPAYQGRPYVDGSPGVGDARVGGSWRTVLASGMGMGARGLFALDVTDPARFAQGLRGIWEFTDADDPAMGHVRQAPLIAKINTGKSVSDASLRYYALVSSGLNNLAADGAGALFLLSLDKPASQPWQRAVNYFSIATAGAGGALPNALSAPALVLAGDGSASRAYAGDLHGNLWRFDFNAMAAHRLFTARDDSGAPQPIAHAPKVVFAPGGGYLILFATGKLIEASDLLPPSFTQQSVYAILDAPGARDGAVVRSQLAPRTLSATSTGYAVKGGRFTYFGPDAKKGWCFDFPNARAEGERAAGAPVSIDGAIVVASSAAAAQEDAAPVSRLYVLDALTGFAYDAASGARPDAATGMPAPFDPSLPLLFISSVLSKGERAPTGGATATHRVTLVAPQAGTRAAPVPAIEVRRRAGRLGWREVSNWQELHQAATGKQR
ncbi:pilus assembly protein [Massilia sp. TSP1-1-2]|uniref:pilus assembly protein n=1 Tax=unclassified Massilia TaxID=2609279 RepID=UPI003CF4BE6D